jgi:hypothetical protein
MIIEQVRLGSFLDGQGEDSGTEIGRRQPSRLQMVV